MTHEYRVSFSAKLPVQDAAHTDSFVFPTHHAFDRVGLNQVSAHDQSALRDHHGQVDADLSAAFDSHPLAARHGHHGHDGAEGGDHHHKLDAALQLAHDSLHIEHFYASHIWDNWHTMLA